jgi:DNA polymerase III sliding clamp (beta) subunit (PCNA family)
MTEQIGESAVSGSGIGEKYQAKIDDLLVYMRGGKPVQPADDGKAQDAKDNQGSGAANEMSCKVNSGLSTVEPVNITPVIIAPKIIKAIEPDSVIIPAPEKIEGTKEKRITRVYFTFPNGLAVLRTIEGSFPDYAGLIPKKCPSRLETGRSEFLKSIRKIRQFVSVENDMCKITANGSLIISAKNEEKGVEISEEVPGELTGKEQTIGINPGFVFDVLSGMKSERVSIYFQGAGGPMLVESVADSGAFFALIMPVNLDN